MLQCNVSLPRFSMLEAEFRIHDHYVPIHSNQYQRQCVNLGVVFCSVLVAGRSFTVR